MTGKLAGRTALITGASAGIGKATALALAGAGASLILTGRRQGALDDVAAACQALGIGARVIVGDLNDAGFPEHLAAESDGADIMINNAGMLVYAPLLDTDMANVETMFRTNVVAAFAISLAVAKRMAAKKRGHMVFVTSGAARNVNPNGTVYSGTKHALSAFAKGFRAELKPFGIKISEVAPGMVDTEIRNASTHPAVVKSLQGRPYKPLTAEDVAEAILYVVSTSQGSTTELLELKPQGS